MDNVSVESHKELKLRNTFISLLSEKEYSTITIKELASAAGINRTSFYLFYESKEELAKETCASFLDEYSQMLADSFTLFPNDNTDKQIQAAFCYLDSKRDEILGLWSIQERSFSPYLMMQKTIEDSVFQALQRQKSALHQEEANNFYAKMYAANAITTVKWWLENGQNYSYAYISKSIIDCCMKGLNSLLSY